MFTREVFITTFLLFLLPVLSCSFPKCFIGLNKINTSQFFFQIMIWTMILKKTYSMSRYCKLNYVGWREDTGFRYLPCIWLTLV